MNQLTSPRTCLLVMLLGLPRAALAADTEPAAASVSIGAAGSSADATPASDEPAEPSDESRLLYERGGLAGIGLVAGLKLGGGFSQPFNALGGSFVAEVEAGFTLPPLDHAIEIFVAGQYSGPKTEDSGVKDTFGPADASRLPGPMSYEVKEDEAILTLGGLFRIPLSIPLFRPYAALGGRMYLLRTTVNGKAGTERFGENQETATKFGFYGALGGELHFGPGAALLEVQTGYAAVDGFVLRSTNVGALNVALGYRFFI